MKQPLLADENIPQIAVEMLVERGWDVRSIGVEHASEKDPEVLQLAIQYERLLVSQDRDFGALIFVQNTRPPQGVLYLRLGPVKPIAIVEAIEFMLLEQEVDYGYAIVVYDGEKWRRRSYQLPK